MSLADTLMEHGDSNPIDIVESLAARHEWDFDRLADDHIAMSVEGMWRIYTVSIAWSGYDDTLKLFCNFDLETSSANMPSLLDAINRANDLCWTGAFTYMRQQKLMAYRYGLVLASDASISIGQIERLLSSAYATCERFYPAFQLVAFGDQTPEEAMHIAIAEAYGRA